MNDMRLCCLVLLIINTVVVSLNSVDTRIDDAFNSLVAPAPKDISEYFVAKQKQQSMLIARLKSTKDHKERKALAGEVIDSILEELSTNFAIVAESDYRVGTFLPDSDVVHEVVIILDRCAYLATIINKVDSADSMLLSNASSRDMYGKCSQFALKTGLIDEFSAKRFQLAAEKLSMDLDSFQEKAKKKSGNVNNDKDEPKNDIHDSERGPRLSRSEL